MTQGLPQLTVQAIPQIDPSIQRRCNKGRSVGRELARDDAGQMPPELVESLLDHLAHLVDVDNHAGAGSSYKVTPVGPGQAVKRLSVVLGL